jgi:hypothetical protein
MPFVTSQIAFPLELPVIISILDFAMGTSTTSQQYFGLSTYALVEKTETIL